MKSIKTKAMIVATCLILICMSAFGANTYVHFRAILIDEINNAVVRIADESAEYLTNYINQFLMPLNAISEHEYIQSMDWEKQKDILMNQINPYYQNIALVDTNGIARYVDDSELDLSDRNYIKNTLSGKTSFSEVIISRKTNQPAIMVGVPIRQGEEIKGALIARLDVDFLADFALSRGYGKNGRAYIISEEGTLISRNNDEILSDSYNLYELASEDQRYEAFARYVKESHENSSGYGSYKYDGKQILMGYASIEETNWKIYIGTYEKEALNGLTGLRRTMYIGLLISVLSSILACWIFICKLVKPILEMDHLFAKGAKGDLTIRIKSKSRDELGRLGNSFNRLMDKIKTLTYFDPLTSLLNQYVLEKDLDILIKKEEPQDFSLIMVEIDKFNFLNETYGFTVSDIVLCETARRILSCIDEEDRVYRYKGDEFVVLIRTCTEENIILQKAQELLASIKDCYIIDGKTIDINFNIGVFRWYEDTRTVTPLKALTQAKNYAKYMGTNQFQLYNKEIHEKLMTMNELQADILTGLEKNEFFLVYQPLFYIQDERIAEIEALIRWKHPEKGLLYPDRFIELAEQAGTIINIDYWVLETACKQLKSWRDRNQKPVLLSINISAKSFETKSFVPDITSIINQYEVNPEYLQLEITERMVIKNVEESIQKLCQLRDMGIRVAIDDFGIGYSSLSYIVRLPIDSIKIDKSFVQNITSSKESKAIVTTIINLCKILRLNVIAEGIESKFELDYLKSNQCEIGQGYYFSKPVHIEEIERLLME